MFVMQYLQEEAHTPGRPGSDQNHNTFERLKNCDLAAGMDNGQRIGEESEKRKGEAYLLKQPQRMLPIQQSCP